MEVRIGVQNSAREVVIDAEGTPEQINAAIDSALAAGTTLSLKDDKGRLVLVPAASIAYIDIAASESRKVGFGS